MVEAEANCVFCTECVHVSEVEQKAFGCLVQCFVLWYELRDGAVLVIH